MSVIDQIERLFQKHGDSQYGFEAVSQLEHALQAAALAEQNGADPSLIAAALLHDVGHLLHNLPDDSTKKGIDDQHESLGQRWLQRYFDDPVIEPVRLHVAAKRYLCAIEPEYMASLSEPSIQSMAVQGGVMNPDEVQAFAALTHCENAVRLRRWDDAAKVVGLPTPPLRHFLDVIASSELTTSDASVERVE